jgi:hypothetical protein
MGFAASEKGGARRTLAVNEKHLRKDVDAFFDVPSWKLQVAMESAM